MCLWAFHKHIHASHLDRDIDRVHRDFFYIAADENGAMGSMMQDLAFAIPGVDEAMGFAEIMKYACSLFDASSGAFDMMLPTCEISSGTSSQCNTA